MKVEFEPAAEDEFLRAVRWYAMEAGIEIALAFDDEVQRTLAFLVNNAYATSAAAHGLRKFPLRRFPYSLYIRLERNLLRVVAVAHQSRMPNYWADRM
jgi:toxin ParE1/3/4